MNDVFPAISEVSLKDAEPGAIVKIARFDGPKLALVTDQLANDARSFVWLNPNFPNKPPVIFAEKWRNEPSAMCCGRAVRFELRLADELIDPTGRNSWETAGAIVSIGQELFIRAAPEDPFYGQYRLVNIRSGAVYSDRPPNTLWTFLSWQLWLRDPTKHCDLMLTEFHSPIQRTS